VTIASGQDPLSAEAFVEWLRREGSKRYHHEHPFHVLMHQGKLTKHQLQQWIVNRYYYQTRIPIKDALILAKSDDPTFRRKWIRRIHDHDGERDGQGGLALWRKLARAAGVHEQELVTGQFILPGVRFACDTYVALVRDASLAEAVASSLTELFAPELMAKRVAAWEQHYPWVPHEALEYFRIRISRANRDGEEALAFVITHAITYEQQRRCVAALVRKTEILWHMLDCLYGTYVVDPPLIRRP
jgi:pyrroloquinoline-quinone synthase